MYIDLFADFAESIIKAVLTCRSQNIKSFYFVLSPNLNSSIQLKENQSFLLSPPSKDTGCVRLTFHEGIARLSGSFGNTFPDVTLAFCGNDESSWIRLPNESNLLLEALNDCQIDFQYEKSCPLHHDLMSQWLFDLHLVRHPVGSEARIVSLFQLLVSRFGIRRGDGYFLPFALGHSRIAELIGATRSTVTRQITILRQQKDLYLKEPEGEFLLSARLMESSLNKIICNG
tara:strand:+ start:297 stop:986 length:690 start_codon:yes stop_codon:yes gene_type:complete